MIADIASHKERMCARLSERRARKQVMSNLPKHRDIIEKNNYEITLNLEDTFNQEEIVFDQLIQQGNLNGLIERYPIRETPVLNNIVNGFGIDRNTYEGIVRKLIIDEPEVLNYFKAKLSDLTALIEE